MKAKTTFLVHGGPSPDVKTLTARVRESAERRRAASPAEGAPGLASVEGVLRSQAEVNVVVAGSLRLVAQHLQYAREHFAALEESLRHEEDERARADGRAAERLEEISAQVEALGRKLDGAVERLAAVERRLEQAGVP